MSRTAKLILILGIAFFACGVGYSLWRENIRKTEMAAAQPLRVLCAEGWLSVEALDRFAHARSVPVQLFTYSRPSEFLRQLANTDGKVDVICTSSLLLRSLVRSRWLKKGDFLGLPNAKDLAVDFAHMPYDPKAQYGLPLFWNLYGLFGKEEKAEHDLKQTLSKKKVAVWGDELHVLNLLTHSGVKIGERLEHEQTKELDGEIREFTQSVAHVIKPAVAADVPAALLNSDWLLLPLARVSGAMDQAHHFVLPEDGAAMDVGILAVGDKSAQPELAMELVNALIAPDHALEVHKRLQAGVVHRTFENAETISPWQRPQALRKFPLNRLLFPDLDVEWLPRFEKIYDQNFSNRN